MNKISGTMLPEDRRKAGKWQQLEGLTFFDELAAEGVLEDFLLEYFPDRLEQEAEFQERMATILLRAEATDALLVHFYLLQQLSNAFRTFLQGVSECSQKKIS